MIVRDYGADDAREVCRPFYETVRAVNLGDCSPEQVRAWAPAPQGAGGTRWSPRGAARWLASPSWKGTGLWT